MTIVQLFEKAIPARFREPLRVWFAMRFSVPVVKYLDLRTDFYRRSDLLYQTLEQRLIRSEQYLKEHVAHLERRVAELEGEVRRAESIAPSVEIVASADESSALS